MVFPGSTPDVCQLPPASPGSGLGEEGKEITPLGSFLLRNRIESGTAFKNQWQEVVGVLAATFL